MRMFCVFVVFCFVNSASAFAMGGKCGNRPLVNLVIGHSPNNVGSVSARGRSEYSFNRSFVDELAHQLRSREGFLVRILNPGGRNVSLRARARMIKKLRTGILLSIHHDSVQKRYMKTWRHGGRVRRYSDRFAGYSLFVSNRSYAYGASKRLGMSIGRALKSVRFKRSMHHAEPIRGENRPVVSSKYGLFRYDGLAVLKRTRIPAILVEVGVIVNRDEEQKLSHPRTKQLMADAISLGISRYCQQ